MVLVSRASSDPKSDSLGIESDQKSEKQSKPPFKATGKQMTILNYFKTSGAKDKPLSMSTSSAKKDDGFQSRYSKGSDTSVKKQMKLQAFSSLLPSISNKTPAVDRKPVVQVEPKVKRESDVDSSKILPQKQRTMPVEITVKKKTEEKQLNIERQHRRLSLSSNFVQSHKQNFDNQRKDCLELELSSFVVDSQKKIQVSFNAVLQLYGLFVTMRSFTELFGISRSEDCLRNFQTFFLDFISGRILQVLVSIVSNHIGKKLPEATLLSFETLLYIYLKKHCNRTFVWLRTTEWIDAKVDDRIDVVYYMLDDILVGKNNEGALDLIENSKGINEALHDRQNLAKQLADLLNEQRVINAPKLAIENSVRQLTSSAELKKKELSQLADKQKEQRTLEDLAKISKLKIVVSETIIELKKKTAELDSINSLSDNLQQKIDSLRSEIQKLDGDISSLKERFGLSHMDFFKLGQDHLYRTWYLFEGFILIDGNREGLVDPSSSGYYVIQSPSDLKHHMQRLLDSDKRDVALKRCFEQNNQIINEKISNKSESILKMESMTAGEYENQVDYKNIKFNEFEAQAIEYGNYFDEIYKKYSSENTFDIFNKDYQHSWFYNGSAQKEILLYSIMSTIDMFTDQFFVPDTKCSLCVYFYENFNGDEAKQHLRLNLLDGNYSFLSVFMYHYKSHVESFIESMKENEDDQKPAMKAPKEFEPQILDYSRRSSTNSEPKSYAMTSTRVRTERQDKEGHLDTSYKRQSSKRLNAKRAQVVEISTRTSKRIKKRGRPNFRIDEEWISEDEESEAENEEETISEVESDLSDLSEQEAW